MLAKSATRPIFKPILYRGLNTLSTATHILTCPGQALPPGIKLLETFEPFRRHVKPLLDVLDDVMEDSEFHTYLFNPPNPEFFSQTSMAQPAILATGVIISEIMQREFGIDVMKNVDITLGHSLGEFTALAVAENSRAGVSKEQSLSSMLKIVHQRGRLMEGVVKSASKQGKKFSMVAVIPGGNTAHETIMMAQTFFGRHRMLSNLNSHRQIVICGEERELNEAIAKFKAEFEPAEWKSRRVAFKVLPTDIPFHTPYLREIEPDLAALLAASGPKAATLVKPMIANVDYSVVATMENAFMAMVSATSRTVRFSECISRTLEDQTTESSAMAKQVDPSACTNFVHIGPGKVLSGLVDRTMVGSYVNHSLNTLEGVESYTKYLRDVGKV